ncbi:hypothetical protein MKEN_01006100 [Mycena kentingensis (nom. inval.)]|nr:hypothetical protein MKEN_01006100 [Mycena kentingensis (nom. inval.)]
MHDNIQKHGVSVFAGIDADDSGSLSADGLCRHLPCLARNSEWRTLQLAISVNQCEPSWEGYRPERQHRIQRIRGPAQVCGEVDAIFKHFDKDRSGTMDDMELYNVIFAKFIRDIPVYLVQKLEEK